MSKQIELGVNAADILARALCKYIAKENGFSFEEHFELYGHEFIVDSVDMLADLQPIFSDMREAGYQAGYQAGYLDGITKGGT